MHGYPLRTAVPAVAVALALAVSGCGAEEESHAEPGPVGSSTEPSAAATPTQESSAGAEPLSDYEDAPQVQVARKFAAAIGRDISAGDKDLPRTDKYLSAQGRKRLPVHAAEDLGTTYPGPLPFTPVAVRGDGDIVTCMWTKGWGQDPKTGEPAAERLIAPIRIDMEKAKGTWKVANLYTSTADCAGVEVRGVKW